MNRLAPFLIPLAIALTHFHTSANRLENPQYLPVVMNEAASRLMIAPNSGR